MDTLLTRTKILLPRRPANLLTRERLLDLLYNLLDYRLIIIAAPAGYGKTYLLVDLAHRIDLPVCWYTLDALDQDPQRFIAHFIASIAQRFPDFGKQSSAALQNAARGELDLHRLAETIVNEAYEQIREHFVIVLDDYHAVGDSEAINYFLSRLIQGADENCHLILSSRALLKLPDLPLMVARSQVGGLEFKDLAFRADEIQALMRQNYHLTMPAQAAERLAQETEGWVTGLLLSAQTMGEEMADQVRLARASGVGLYDYLAQQVLEQQPPAVRDFLLHTSLLEEFDAELCEAVMGPHKDWRGLIDTILQSNLFVLPVEDGGTWLRYHHLFRDFLQAHLAQERPEEREHILRQMVAVYAGREEWEKAHQVCQRLNDVAAMADLIERAGSPMIKRGQLTTLAEWLDALPANVLSSSPALLSLRGDTAVMLGEVARGVSLLNQAETALRRKRDLPRLARTLVRRATAHRFSADYQRSLADADEALALAERDENLRAVHAEALRARGIGLYWMGQLNEATQWLERSLEAYIALDDGQNVALLRMELGLAYMDAGRYDQARAHYERALAYWQQAYNVARQAALLNNMGVLYHLRGDYEHAGQLLEQAMDCARQSGYASVEALAISSLGDLYADLDAPRAALEAYRQADQIAQRSDHRFLLLYLSLARAALARSMGDLPQACRRLEAVRQLAQQSNSGYQQGAWRREAGRTALAEGDAPEAIIQLEEAVRHFDDGGQHVEGARAHLYLAVAYLASKDKQAALTHLRHAFHLASDLEGQHTLTVAGRGARALLEAAQGDPAVGLQATRLLRRVIQFEQEIPALRRRLRRQASTVPLTPPKLTFLALGSAQVLVDQRRVTGADWQALVARDLLFCLLAHSDGLTKEALGAIFWPESSPAQLKLQFKKTIYRLRRALGQDVVLFDQDRYQFNHALDYEYDVDAFLEKLAQARATTDTGQRAAACRAAADLYKGPYLPGVDRPWVWPERERLWQSYVEATLRLAEFYLKTGEYGVALDYCQRALAEDPCREEVHRLVMRVYAAMGNRAAVARQFDRCHQALSEEVNVPLSAQTIELYEKLMR